MTKVTKTNTDQQIVIYGLMIGAKTESGLNDTNKSHMKIRKNVAINIYFRGLENT